MQPACMHWAFVHPKHRWMDGCCPCMEPSMPLHACMDLHAQNITLWNALLLKPPPGHFPVTPLVAGGFFFTYGQAVVETPFDPGLDYLFNGEVSGVLQHSSTDGKATVDLMQSPA